MRKLNFKRIKHSLRFKLSLGMLIIILPLVGMLLYNNFYAIHVVREQVSDSYEDSLSLYMNQIDSALNDIDAYLNTVAGSSSELIYLELMANDDEYYMLKTSIFNKLSNDMPLYDLVGSFFVYTNNRRDYMDVYSVGISYSEREMMMGYITEKINKGDVSTSPRTKRWRYAKVGAHYYLINITFKGNVYIGGWIRVDELLKPLAALRLGEDGAVLISDEQGVPMTNSKFVYEHGINLQSNMDDYYISGTKEQFLVVGTDSNRGNFRLIMLIPDRSILSNLPYLKQLIWFITIGALLFIPVGLYYMRQVFLVPIKHILLAMSRVRLGDWGVRVELDSNTDEFRNLGHSFNTMMSEIQTLRVNVFEEQLQKQREELQRLQLQVNPHFFLNSLNIVYNLAKVKKTQLIMEMTDALIHYFRYLFRSNTTFVKLEEELEHTRNYMNIQALRFPGQLTWDIDSPDYLENTPVPPLIIQSFVENSIKHAITMENPIQIDVLVDLEEDADRSNVKIVIKDTGSGFNDKVLHELQAGRSVENERGEHTGIWNVQRRLKLLYKDRAAIQFENDKISGGAIVQIIIPIYPESERVK